ncbi:MAG: type II toxin-antitoxin system RelE/ParE family toxin [Candidatus Zhuqueibacterota bacterium]
MREIKFYRTSSGKCPVEDFLDLLNDQQVKKVLWVLKLVKELEIVPKEYFKKLAGIDNIWEVRIVTGRNLYRILGFFDGSEFVVLTNAFAKKSQKIPRKEIQLAEQRRRDYLERK